MRTDKTRLLLWMISLLFAAQAPEVNADAIVTKDGRTEGREVRFRRSAGEYILERADGSQLTFPKARVIRIEVVKPKNYDSLAQMAERGDIAAIPDLNTMIRAYDGRLWDTKAKDLLGTIYLKKGEAKKAADIYTDLKKNAAAYEITPAIEQHYMDALVADKREGKLTGEVDTIIARGSRENAAVALIKRGDLSDNQGKTPEALWDYLRVVILFKQVKDAQPEALFKAAQTMDKLRDPRAEQFRRELMAEYPQSRWAVTAGAGAGGGK